MTLRALDDAEFKGYIVQARDGSDAIGEFQVPNKDDGKTMDCPGGSQVCLLINVSSDAHLLLQCVNFANHRTP